MSKFIRMAGTSVGAVGVEQRHSLIQVLSPSGASASAWYLRNNAVDNCRMLVPVRR